MMPVSLMGDLVDQPHAHRDWAEQHGQWHDYLAAQTVALGYAFYPTSTLHDHPFTPDWFLAHAREHIGLAYSLGLPLPLGLERVDWSDLSQRGIWHRTHVQAHRDAQTIAGGP